MSIVRREFKDQIPYWIRKLPKVQKNWTSMLQTLEGHMGRVSSVAFSRDGKAMATSGYAGWLKVWTLDGTKVNDKPSFSQKLKAFGAYCVVFSPDGKSLVTGHDNKNIYITPIGK